MSDAIDHTQAHRASLLRAMSAHGVSAFNRKVMNYHTTQHQVLRREDGSTVEIQDRHEAVGVHSPHRTARAKV